eukprot:gene15384-66674_t
MWEGVRTIDLELLVGNTIKREVTPGSDDVSIRVDTSCQNEVLREKVSIRVTQALLRVPPKHTEFNYVEHSGPRRIAPFEVMPDEEVWVDNYNGGYVHVKCVEGCTEDDYILVKGDEKDTDALD